MGAKATLTVKNDTSSTKSFLITVSMNDANGNRIAELNAAANSVAAGQSATVEAIGAAQNAPEGDHPCVVAKVTVI